MKTLTLGFCLLLLLLLPAPLLSAGQADDLAQRIKTFRNSKRFAVKYDRFKDETQVSVGPFYPDHKAVGMEACFSFPGSRPIEQIKSIRFVLRARVMRDWRFLNDRALYAIVDGARMELGEGDRSSDIYLNASTETLTFTIPIESFKKLATAKSAAIKVAAIELTFKDEHFAAFQDFLTLTTP